MSSASGAYSEVKFESVLEGVDSDASVGGGGGTSEELLLVEFESARSASDVVVGASADGNPVAELVVGGVVWPAVAKASSLSFSSSKSALTVVMI